MEPGIERISMDGNNATRQHVIKDNIGWPNGLTLDLKQKKIYWVDAKLKRLEVASVDGNGRRILLHHENMFPFSLTNINTRLYWSDWLHRKIMTTTKFNSLGNLKQLSREVFQVFDVKIFDKSKQPIGEEKNI